MRSSPNTWPAEMATLTPTDAADRDDAAAFAGRVSRWDPMGPVRLRADGDAVRMFATTPFDTLVSRTISGRLDPRDVTVHAGNLLSALAVGHRRERRSGPGDRRVLALPVAADQRLGQGRRATGGPGQRAGRPGHEPGPRSPRPGRRSIDGAARFRGAQRDRRRDGRVGASCACCSRSPAWGSRRRTTTSRCGSAPRTPGCGSTGDSGRCSADAIRCSRCCSKEQRSNALLWNRCGARRAAICPG